jgi:ethanolamine ammonia-lyase large subunit
MIRRRTFLGALAASTAGLNLSATPTWSQDVQLQQPLPDEDLFDYCRRTNGTFDQAFYKKILGAANPFKEGDQIIGVSAANEATRQNARRVLAATRIRDIDAHSVHDDQLSVLIEQARDTDSSGRTPVHTLADLRAFLLTAEEDEIKSMMSGLSSHVIGCVVKIMTNQQLIAVGAKVFNPLPGSNIGANGYLGARLQPNSPTDNTDDIRWQVLDGWSYAVGDLLLGTNPVSSAPESVAAVERTLRDLLETFGISDVMPHCVLSHIDVQAEVEQKDPGSTALWFQSIAGCDSANATFDISVEKMRRYAGQRTGKYGLYFETGQGADFTNGHGHGFDMVIHESRKYGFARALTQQVAAAQSRAGLRARPWVHLNDVAGFIGPEVFRTREQLVRCCLEDIVMGKLHGLCLGLDVCSTLHMDVSLDDLDWCLEQIVPACPAYLMALPTKIDPMLGYLTTGFQDHVRLREMFGLKVDDRMEQFFQQLGVLDNSGKPTEHFGNPLWVYKKYCQARGDKRSDAQIFRDGEQQLQQVGERGVFIARGHAKHPWTLAPKLAQDVRRIYDDAKKSIWTELTPGFVATVPNAVKLETRSSDRTDYILHPESGEQLSAAAVAELQRLREKHSQEFDVQIVVSDGLNAMAIMDPGHLAPFLDRVRTVLKQDGYRVADENLVVNSGRVRAGYRIGETLFADLPGQRAIIHVIGERPGTGHHTFSIYVTAPEGPTWGRPGLVDHNITKVVSGIATTALDPTTAADETVRILKTLET